MGTVLPKDGEVVLIESAKAVNRFAFKDTKESNELQATVKLTLTSGRRCIVLEQSRLDASKLADSFAWDVAKALNEHLPSDRRGSLTSLIKLQR